MTSTGVERPYTDSDLNGLNKDQLILCVKSQLNRWPTRSSGKGRGRKKGFNPSKDTIPIIRAALLDPNGTFTTTGVMPNQEVIPPPPPPHMTDIGGVKSQQPMTTALPVAQQSNQQSNLARAPARAPAMFVFPPSLAAGMPPASESLFGTFQDTGAASTTQSTETTNEIIPTSLEAALTAPTTANSISTGPMPPTFSTGNTSEFKSLTVFLEDDRLSSHRKTAHDIFARFAGEMGCNNGQWRALTKDIVDELDRTGSIKGFIRLSCPHHRNPQFMNEFMVRRPGNVSDNEIIVSTLVVSGTSELFVHIEDAVDLKRITTTLKLRHDVVHGVEINEPAEGLTAPSQEGPETSCKRAREQDPDAEPETDLKPLERARKRSKQNTSKSNSNTPQVNQETVAWLKAKAAKRDGYELYVHSQNRTRQMQNSEIVKYWDFGASFVKEYFKKNCPMTNQKVKKTFIDLALDCGETWRNEAEKATEWIQSYGQSAEVREELEMQRDVPLGIGALYKFLKDWDASHKM